MLWVAVWVWFCLSTEFVVVPDRRCCLWQHGSGSVYLQSLRLAGWGGAIPVQGRIAIARVKGVPCSY